MMRALRHTTQSFLSLKRVQPARTKRRWSRLAYTLLGGLLLNIIGLFFLSMPVTAQTSHASAGPSAPPPCNQNQVCDRTITVHKPTPPPACSGLTSCIDQEPTLTPTLDVLNPFPGGSTLLFYTDPIMTLDNPMVKSLQGIILSIVNGFIVVIVALTGLRLIVSGSTFRYANAIESLPGVLLSLIAAQFASVFAIFVLGVNNFLSVGLYTIVANSKDLSASPSNLCSDWLNRYVRCPTGTPLNLTVIASNLDFTNLWTNLLSLTDITGLIVKILVLMLLGQLIIRLLLIIFYGIFGSAALAALALPARAGQPVFALWFQGFISTVMVQFLQVAGLIIVGLVLGAIASYVNLAINPDQLHPVLPPDSLANIMKISVLWFVLRIPNLLGTAPLRTMAEAGQAMQQAVATSVGISIAETQVVGGMVQSGIGAGVAVIAAA